MTNFFISSTRWRRRRNGIHGLYRLVFRNSLLFYDPPSNEKGKRTKRTF